MKPRVLYHASCQDGFCAAWVAHRFFGEGADYQPVNYGEPPPDVSGREGFILDFSYKRPVLNQMVGKARTLVVCDHHKTVAADLAEFYSTNSASIGTITRNRGDVYCVFDMNKSGGRLAWEFFFCNVPSPWLVDYTEDRDLWRWKLAASRQVSAALASYPQDFAVWDDFHKMTTPIDTLAREGASILRYQEQAVANQCKNAALIDLDGHKVLSVNATMLISEIAGQLAKDRPFGATWFERADGKRVWSLRSTETGVDVSKIAKKHGGGGHARAAGFEQETPT